MIRNVFPKQSDSTKILMVSNVVFDTVRFGPQSVLSFVQRFPKIPLAVFFTEVLWDNETQMYTKSNIGKNNEAQVSVSTHTHLLNSTVVCTPCNIA